VPLWFSFPHFGRVRLLAGLIVGIGGLGDLTLSMTAGFWRGCGLVDPGHGGLLDRVDA
jgi:predicted CDP-diglyceride synthetase/phosphatidate cytidylyltransferase